MMTDRMSYEVESRGKKMHMNKNIARLAEPPASQQR